VTPSARAVAAAVAVFATVALIALAIESCGKSSLSAPALRRDASRLCTIGRHRTSAIAIPRSPTAATTFLTRGLAVLEPELAALRLLNPPAAAALVYKRAVDGFGGQVAAMRSTLSEISHGGDPIAAFRALQAQLDPIEIPEDSAWKSLGIDACARQ
jgi:hypothetical protein